MESTTSLLQQQGVGTMDSGQRECRGRAKAGQQTMSCSKAHLPWPCLDLAIRLAIHLLHSHTSLDPCLQRWEALYLPCLCPAYACLCPASLSNNFLLYPCRLGASWVGTFAIPLSLNLYHVFGRQKWVFHGCMTITVPDKNVFAH